MATYTVSAGWTLSGTKLYSGTTISTVTLQNGDTVNVLKGGTAEAFSLTANETLEVNGAGTTSGITISSGGDEVLLAGAKAYGTTVLSGGDETLSGGTFTNSAAVVSSGGILNLDYTDATQSNPIELLAGATINWNGTTSTTLTSSTAPSGNVTLQVGSEKVTISGSLYSGTSKIVGGHLSTAIVVCFAAGTQILTGAGEVAIETLQPGGTVAVLRNGETVLEPISWIGKTKINLAWHARPELAAPIRVKAGALAENTPARDLLLSPEHCLILGGRCIPVKLLVNGGSIAREFPAGPFEYYHIELEKHGILIAEGAAAESYLDTGNRASFDNAGAPSLLHPTFEVNATSERWTTDACAPLAVAAAEIVPVREALAERSIALGHGIAVPAMIEEADLHILADGKRIQPVSDRNSRYVFVVPAGTTSVSLASRFVIPADRMVAAEFDTRRLGVSVNWIAIRSDDAETIISADNPALNDGWNEPESQGKAIWRWTDGAATIPWTNVAGTATLTVCCTPADRYPMYDAQARLVA